MRRAAAAPALFAVFWALRTRNFALGDSAHLIQAVTYFGIRFGYRATYNEPLEILTHTVLFRFAHDLFGASVETVYAAASCAAGVAVVMILARLFVRGAVPRERALAGLVPTLSAGVFAIYFGSVEHYCLVGLLMIAAIAATHRYLARGGSILPAALAAGGAVSFHVLGGWLLPPLFAAPFLGSRRQRRTRDLLVAAAGVGLPVLATIALLTALGVPLASIRDTHLGRMKFVFLLDPTYRYFQFSMFSAAHLEAAVNELLLTSFPGLAAIAYLALAHPRAVRLRGDRFALFLAALAVSFQVFALTWNPDLGPANDWDLFAVVGYGYALLGGWLLARSSVPWPALRYAVVPIAAVGLLVSASFVVWNHSTAVEVDSGHARAHLLAGNDAVRRGDLASAAEHYSEAVRLDPGNAIAHRNLGETLRRLGRREEAIRELRQSLRLDPAGPFAAKARRSLEALGAAPP
ncbi:MAG: tetratricopeptide repeat protein [Acidobacteria bacterium]|nr:MAG: tetratricopeptide repeat protein [Acidobacteriota bacterium]